MSGKTIGSSLGHGYAGSYARQPDMIIETYPLHGEETVPFGAPLQSDGQGGVKPFGAASTADAFAGVASKTTQSPTSFAAESGGEYQPGQAVAVFQRGSINVLCRVGTPMRGGKVYIRVKANDSIPTGVVGGFEAAADGVNTIELAGCQWRGAADANKVAELVLLTRSHA